MCLLYELIALGLETGIVQKNNCPVFQDDSSSKQKLAITGERGD
jgi:hypothetical protein